MPFLPDYGLLLRDRGFGEGTFYFHNFVFYNIMVLGGGRFRTTVEKSYGDERYLLSVDFTAEHLQAVLSRAPEDVRETITRELTRDSKTVRSLELPDGIHCGIAATHGEVLHGPDEDYSPLVILEILDKRRPASD